MKRSRGEGVPARSKAPAVAPKRSKAAPPEDASSEEEETMSHAPVFRSLSVETSPSVPLLGHTPSPTPITPFVPVSSPGANKSHALVGRSEAQSPVRLVSERDLLKRVLRKKFEAQFRQEHQTHERWCSWIDEQWNALSPTEQRIFYSECERINSAACAAQERRASSAPAICAPAGL